MANQLPFPYKLVVIRKESEEWLLAHVSTFDCAEPPIASLGSPNIDLNNSLYQLANLSVAALVFINSALEKINNSPVLEGTGCKYCLFGVDAARYEGNWDRICIVLKLANSKNAFRETIGEPVAIASYARGFQNEDAVMLRFSGQETPMSSGTQTLDSITT